MIKSTRISLAIAVFALSSVAAVRADAVILAADLPDLLGADTFLTRDTDSNLDWLDVNLTRDTSFDALTSGAATFTSLGGFNPITDFGFRHASLAELSTLLSNAGIPDVDSGFTALNFAPVNALSTLLSPTGSNGQITEFLKGITSFVAAPGIHTYGILQICQSTGPNCSLDISPIGAFFSGLAGTSLNNIADGMADAATGHYLVRDTPPPVDPPTAISEPTTIALLCAGLVGLGFARRRRTTVFP